MKLVWKLRRVSWATVFWMFTLPGCVAVIWIETAVTYCAACH